VGGFSSAVSALLDESPTAIELDTERLDFSDSAGLHALVRAEQAADRAGTPLGIVRRSGAVDRVLDIIGLRDQLVITSAT
jgi:anti-anti-sigma factor